MKDLSNEELLHRIYMREDPQLRAGDELLSRLARVQELEKEVEQLKALAYRFKEGNKKSLQEQYKLMEQVTEGQRAIEKLERIRGLIYKYCQKQDCGTCNALTCPITQERCDMTYDLKDILAEEG